MNDLKFQLGNNYFIIYDSKIFLFVPDLVKISAYKNYNEYNGYSYPAYIENEVIRKSSEQYLYDISDLDIYESIEAAEQALISKYFESIITDWNESAHKKLYDKYFKQGVRFPTLDNGEIVYKVSDECVK